MDFQMFAGFYFFNTPDKIQNVIYSGKYLGKIFYKNQWKQKIGNEVSDPEVDGFNKLL